MTLGDGFLGEGPLGEPTPPNTLADKPTRPRAIQFNPATRDHVKDTNGRYVDLHPVDAGVVQSMMFAASKMPGAPRVGQTLASVQPGDQIIKDADTRTRLAVDWLVKRKDIQIVAVVVEPHGPNAFFVELDYVNLRLLPLQKKTARAVFGG